LTQNKTSNSRFMDSLYRHDFSNTEKLWLFLEQIYLILLGYWQFYNYKYYFDLENRKWNVVKVKKAKICDGLKNNGRGLKNCGKELKKLWRELQPRELPTFRHMMIDDITLVRFSYNFCVLLSRANLLSYRKWDTTTKVYTHLR